MSCSKIHHLIERLDRAAPATDLVIMTTTKERQASVTDSGALPDQTLSTEVLIVGGGLVGLSLATALADAGLAVVLVDRDDPTQTTAAAYDGRTSAISRGSQRILDSLGIWSRATDQAQPIEEIRVSDGRPAALGEAARAAPFFLHYGPADIGEPGAAEGASGAAAMGAIVENRVLRQACLARVAELPNLRFLAPCRAGEITRERGRVLARLEGGGAVTAQLLVAADGRFSPLREAAGIAVNRWDYPQVGIVATVAHEQPHGAVAHEHFLPAGPFALLPMVDGPLEAGGPTRHRSSLVWTERRDLAPQMMALDDTDFAAEMTRCFGDSLGALQVAGRRWSYPLSLVHAQRYSGHRLALIGDAAHAIHPIAGQGLNLGIRDVAALAEAIVDARRLGLDIGASDLLERYERWRRFDNTALVAATDLLNRLFSNDSKPLRLARDLGLAAVNRLPPLKRVFVQHAMGTLGDLPRLARGKSL